MANTDQLLLDAINDLPDGKVLNVIQAARELEGSLYDRLSKAYAEATGDWGGPDDMIRLR